MRTRWRNRISEVFAVPIFRRIAFHLRRIGGELDRGFFLRLGVGLGAIVTIAALIVTAI